MAHAFLFDSFKKLDKLTFLRKGMLLLDSLTHEFSRKTGNVASGQTECGQTLLANWFSSSALERGSGWIGQLCFTLTVVFSDELAEDPDFAVEEALIDSWTPRFVRGR